MENRIKLVVFNEHSLGYILPEQPKSFHPLKESVLKGAPYTTNAVGTSKHINPTDKIRLASEEDFESFKVSFEGYKKDPQYEYEKSLTDEV